LKNNRKRYKKILIAIAMLVLIYFVWGWFGFAGGWILPLTKIKKMPQKMSTGLITTVL